MKTWILVLTTITAPPILENIVIQLDEKSYTTKESCDLTGEFILGTVPEQELVFVDYMCVRGEKDNDTD